MTAAVQRGGGVMTFVGIFSGREFTGMRLTNVVVPLTFQEWAKHTGKFREGG